ncbi:MAG TPA: lactate utilization protein C [Terracidiphilus sp.]|jgi:L-lactate dehydrogenase complex protein LldG|nr:lactate utilization protein C [Terracidiphilus sp.]
MKGPMPSRLLILDRLRTATVRPAHEESPILRRRYIRRGQLSEQARIQLMADRLWEYDAEVVKCTSENLVGAITDRLQMSKRLRFAAPAGLPAEWTVPGFDWKIDHNMTYEEIEQCDGVVTTAFAGIAESGTIVLHHSQSEGRRALSLLPDWHLCILRTDQVVETLPEYFDLFRNAPQFATYISGPSATADIEMTRIKGVHGPRFLNVILVQDTSKVDTAAIQGRSQ